eukprot:364385-Chlamydomonas_euryale.AAC.4
MRRRGADASASRQPPRSWHRESESACRCGHAAPAAVMSSADSETPSRPSEDAHASTGASADSSRSGGTVPQPASPDSTMPAPAHSASQHGSTVADAAAAPRVVRAQPQQPPPTHVITPPRRRPPTPPPQQLHAMWPRGRSAAASWGRVPVWQPLQWHTVGRPSLAPAPPLGAQAKQAHGSLGPLEPRPPQPHVPATTAASGPPSTQRAAATTLPHSDRSHRTSSAAGDKVCSRAPGPSSQARPRAGSACVRRTVSSSRQGSPANDGTPPLPPLGTPAPAAAAPLSATGACGGAPSASARSDGATRATCANGGAARRHAHARRFPRLHHTSGTCVLHRWPTAGPARRAPG